MAMNFQQQFKAARRVSTPLVAIRTFDAESAVNQVRSILGPKLVDTPMILWDCVHGMRALTEKGEVELGYIVTANEADKVATIALDTALRFLEKARQDTIFFISNMHLFIKEPAVIQACWNLRESFKANGDMLVMLCHPGAVMPAELSNDVFMMDEPLPTAVELEAKVRKTFEFAKIEAPPAEVIAKAVDALIGLPMFPSEQAAAMCVTSEAGKGGQRKGGLDLDELWGRKRTIINQTPGLTIWPGKERLDDIGGVQVVKDFYNSVIHGRDGVSLILWMDELEKAFAGSGTDLSGVKGELTGTMLQWMQDTGIIGSISIGVPGVSKSQLIKAVGGSHGKPVIKFDVAAMQGGIIGSSGANLRAAQKTVDAIKGSGKVFAIATCNAINSLPPELQGRFNLGTFFFDVPTASEAAAIWDIYRKRYEVPEGEETPAHVGWTGREIEECARKAWSLRLTLKEAAQYIVPVTISRADSIRSLRESCSGKYLSASTPGVYQYHGAELSKVAPSAPVFAAEQGRRIREE